MRNKISWKPMKLVLNLLLSFLVVVTLGNRSFSLTDYKIKNICKKEKKKSTCIKVLREKRSNLQKGNLIEIPVVPYKSN